MSLRFGDCELDTDARELRRRGERVALTPKAYELLALLVLARPKALKKSEINDSLWPDTFVTESSLAGLVFEVRQALGDDARQPRFLRTLRGHGYAFSAEAEARAATAPGEPRPSYRLIGETREVELALGENILGRCPEAVLWIESLKASRRHARIVVASDGASLEDLGSKNGTRLNGRQLSEPARLEDGDTIQVGEKRWTVRVMTGDQSTETSSRDSGG